MSAANPEPAAQPAGSPLSRARAEQMAELFRRYNARLVHSLIPLVGSEQDARDIAQQAYVQLLQLERPDAVSFFGGFLYQTARNLATDRQRAEAARRRLDPIALFEPVESAKSPEPLCIARERAEIVLKAIQELSPRCRMAFWLKIHDGLRYEDIVARLAEQGVNVDLRTVKRYVAKALVYCRTRIEEADTIRRGPR